MKPKKYQQELKRDPSITNVIFYCRVSTDEQRQSTSVDVQEERLKAYCVFKGYNIIYALEFKDCKEDESA